MKRIHTIHQLIAIVLMAWFVVPVCCCSGKSIGGDTDSAKPSCCQKSRDHDGDNDNGEAPKCPCGKRTLVEGKAENTTIATRADTIPLMMAEQWVTESAPVLEIAASDLPQYLDLPPPGASWFAISGSWLL